jgi:YgiT-type zinc finger domain-containing protein
MAEALEPLEVCPHCQTGIFQPRLVTFAQWFEGQFITIPHFPAWLCDVCGTCEYDTLALEQLAMLLGSEASLRRAAVHRAARGTPRAVAEFRSPGRRRLI